MTEDEQSKILEEIARRKASLPPVVEWVDVKLTTELDGGLIEVTDPKIVAMGDVFAHRQLTYTHNGDTSQPACKFVFEVRNGVPVCVSVHLWTDGENYVRAKYLSAIKLDDLRDDVYAAAGVFEPNPDGGFVQRIGRFHQNRKHVEPATQRRRFTPGFVAQVAQVHNEAPVGGRLAAVCAAFRVRERQALRYIAQARQRGLIDG